MKILFNTNLLNRIQNFIDKFITELDLSDCSEFEKIEKSLIYLTEENKKLNKIISEEYKKTSETISKFIELKNKNEEELKIAKSKADASDLGKNNLLRKVCHDIGNRMSESVGIAEIMLKTDNLPDGHYKKLHQIIDSLRVMDNSLQLMRDRTMIMTGQSRLYSDNIDLNEFVKVHVNSFISGIEEKGLKFILDMSDECKSRKDCFVLTDAAKLDAIIGNLIGNAKKFTKEGSITWKIEILEESNIDILIKFTISDTGIGIDSSEYEKIFEVYEQANESIQKEYGGSGQGLAIVRSYIRMMDSDIQVYSEGYGKGTTFTFELKFIKPKYIPKIKDIDLSKEELTSFKILAADDSPMIRDILVDKFSEIGLNYKIVSSGEDVLNLASTEFFDFIFLDIQMGGISGIDTARILREKINTPIIALTANFSDIDKEDYQTHGIDDCIGKPFESDKIKLSIIKYKDRQVLDIERIKKEFTKDLFMKLVFKFKNEFESNYDRLKEISNSDLNNITDEDLKEFNRIVHTIKGNASIIYTDNIRHMCYLLEQKGNKNHFKRNTDRESIINLVDKLYYEYKHFLTHINENYNLEE